MSSIFVSHSSKDKELTKDLVSRLETRNHSIFIDYDREKGIKAGKSWEETLYRKLRACQALVAICTENYFNSRWCFAEIALARMLGKRVFPLRYVDSSDKIPVNITINQMVDLRNHSEDSYERLWDELDKIGVIYSTRSWENESPYLGLNVYQEEHSEIFFGREEEIQKGIELIRRGTPGLIMILGASGSGKSSLMRAGIIPRLRQAYKDQYIVIDPFRCGHNPYDSIVNSLSKTLNDLDIPISDDLRVLFKQISVFRVPKNQKTQILEDVKTPLIDIVEKLRGELNRLNLRILFTIDQFEEFLEVENADQNIGHFLELVRYSVEYENIPLMVLVTMRTDFLEGFLRTSELQGIDYEDLKLGSMTREQMRRVINEPARLGAIELESGLDNILLDDTETPDALPLLSFTLWVLYRDYIKREEDDHKIEIKEYTEGLKRLNGAITKEAEALLELAKKEGKEEELRQAFIRMVRLTDEGSYARRPVNWDDKKLLPVHDILLNFEKRRLLFFRAEDGPRMIELAHEALIRSWEPLKQWLAESRDFFAWYKRFSISFDTWQDNPGDQSTLLRGGVLAIAQDWVNKQPDDLDTEEHQFIQQSITKEQYNQQKKIRQARRIAVGSFIFLVIISGLSSLAWVQSLEVKRKSIDGLVSSSERFLDADNRLDSLIEIIKAEKLRTQSFGLGEDIRTKIAFAFTRSLNHNGENNRLEGHSDWVNGVDISSDGKTIASASNDSSIKLWKTDGTPLDTLDEHSEAVLEVSFNPKDSNILASSSFDKTIKIWNLQTGKVIQEIANEDWFSSVRFSPDGELLVGGCADNTVKIYRASGQLLKTFPGHTATVFDAIFNSDGSQLLSVSEDGTAKIWSTQTEKMIISIPGEGGAAYSGSFSPAGEMIAVAYEDGKVRLWTQKGKLVRTLEGHKDSVLNLRFSPDGETLVSTSKNGSVIAWKVSNGQKIKIFRGHQQSVGSVRFVKGGKKIITGSHDRTIRVWSFPELKPRSLGQQRGINAIKFSLDGQSLVSANNDGSLNLWNRDGLYIKSLGGHEQAVLSIDFSPNGESVVSGSEDSTVRIWSSDGKLKKVLSGHQEMVSNVTYSHDGQMIASASHDKTVKLWTSEGDFKRELVHQDWINSVIFSRDSPIIITGSADGKINVWNYQDGSLLQSLEAHKDGVLSTALSPDQTKVISSGADNLIRLWNFDNLSLKPIDYLFNGHTDSVMSAIFTPEGNKVISASLDNTIKAWTLKGHLIHSTQTHSSTGDSGFSSLSFRSDGEVLASVSFDYQSSPTFWTLSTKELRAMGCNSIIDYLQTNQRVGSSDKDLCH